MYPIDFKILPIRSDSDSGSDDDVQTHIGEAVPEPKISPRPVGSLPTISYDQKTNTVTEFDGDPFDLTYLDSVLRTNGPRSYQLIRSQDPSLEGNFGVVTRYLMYERSTGQYICDIAVKKSKPLKSCDHQELDADTEKNNPSTDLELTLMNPEDLRKEALRLDRGKGNRLVPKVYAAGKLHDSVIEDDRFYILMEWLPYDLYALLEPVFDADLPSTYTAQAKPWLLDTFYTLVTGLLDLYETYQRQTTDPSMIAFGDLKPDHLLVQEDGSVKLIDFMPGNGTKGYIPPDRLAARKTDHDFTRRKQADVFALGVMMTEAFTGRDHETFLDPKTGLIKDHTVFDDVQNADLAALLRTMTHANPDTRPTLNMIQTGSVFSGYTPLDDHARKTAWDQFKATCDIAAPSSYTSSHESENCD